MSLEAGLKTHWRGTVREKKIYRQLLIAPALRIGMPSPFPTPGSPMRHPKRAATSAAADRGPSNIDPERDGGSKLNLGLSLLHVCKGEAGEQFLM